MVVEEIVLENGFIPISCPEFSLFVLLFLRVNEINISILAEVKVKLGTPKNGQRRPFVKRSRKVIKEASVTLFKNETKYIDEFLWVFKSKVDFLPSCLSSKAYRFCLTFPTDKNVLCNRPSQGHIWD